MVGDQPLDRLGDNILRFLAHYLHASVGALFMAEGDSFRRVAGYAIPAGSDDTLLRPGDGLAGQAARDNRPLRVRDVPQNYLPVSSGTGRGSPAELLIAPASIDGRVYAVLELGFFEEASAGRQELLERVSGTDRGRHPRIERPHAPGRAPPGNAATGRGAADARGGAARQQRRAGRTGNALRESRAHLESQQAELEQINSQLEEQTQLLEHQKESLSKSHAVLTAKSSELQRANEYKSEFLANMSHELRTPLNSTRSFWPSYWRDNPLRAI